MSEYGDEIGYGHTERVKVFLENAPKDLFKIVELNIHNISKDLISELNSKELIEIMKMVNSADVSVLVIDGSSEKFKSFVQNISESFKVVVLLTPLFDINHSFKIGVSRACSPPNCWKVDSFRSLLLGPEYSIFRLIHSKFRFFRILRNLMLEMKVHRFQKRNVKILISLGKFPNTSSLQLIISFLKSLQKLIILDLVEVYITVPDLSYQNLTNLNTNNFKVNITLNNGIDISDFQKWDYVVTGGGLTLMEFLSLGFRCIVLPVHSFQEDFLKDLDSKLIFNFKNIEGDKYYSIFRSWMQQRISPREYLNIFIRFQANSSKKIWYEILEVI